MTDFKDDRIGAALRGENPMVMVRMRSGFACIGDTQFLPGYCVLLVDDERITRLEDLDLGGRTRFLTDMALLGEAVARACGGPEFRRINYAIMGNDLAVLHAHVHPRYSWEPEDLRRAPAWTYPAERWEDASYVYDERRHGQLRAAITDHLRGLVETLQ